MVEAASSGEVSCRDGGGAIRWRAIIDYDYGVLLHPPLSAKRQPMEAHARPGQPTSAGTAYIELTSTFH